MPLPAANTTKPSRQPNPESGKPNRPCMPTAISQPPSSTLAARASEDTTPSKTTTRFFSADMAAI